MRHDFEKALTEAVAAYLEAQLDAEVQTAAPVVAFYDPMAAEDGARIVVICESGETKEAGPGEGIGQVQVVVKTPWGQPGLDTAVTEHFERVNTVRDAFTVSDPETAIAAVQPAGISITRIESVRRWETQMDREAAYFMSGIELNVHFNTAEE